MVEPAVRVIARLALLMLIVFVTSEAGAYVPSPPCEAVMLQFPVPPALAVKVTLLPAVLVPDPVQPAPKVEIATGNPEGDAVAETVNVSP